MILRDITFVDIFEGGSVNFIGSLTVICRMLIWHFCCVIFYLLWKSIKSIDKGDCWKMNVLLFNFFLHCYLYVNKSMNISFYLQCVCVYIYSVNKRKYSCMYVHSWIKTKSIQRKRLFSSFSLFLSYMHNVSSEHG